MVTLRRKHPNDHLPFHSKVLTCASLCAVSMHRAALDYNLRNAQLFLLLAFMASTHPFTLASLRVGSESTLQMAFSPCLFF